MFGALTSLMFSLNVRDEAMVNCAAPALMLEDGVLQPLPEAITSCEVGESQLRPRLPPEVIQARVMLPVTKASDVLLFDPRNVRPDCKAKKSFSVPFEAP